MGGREIIIADGDTRYRSLVTDYFRKVGYRVATADSVEQVLASVQESQTQVLLLGGGFSTKISASDLVRLLKKCSRKLRIIMVSEGMSLAQARQVRQEGIFYYALKPATTGDTEELGQAVACAFERRRISLPGDPISAQPGSRPALSEVSGETDLALPQPMKYLSWVAAMVAAICAASYHLLAAASLQGHHGSASPACLIFLGLCASLVAGQALPPFRIKLAPGWVLYRHATQESTPRGGALFQPRATRL